MLNLSLRAIPNQSLIATLDGFRYEVTIKDIGGSVVYGIVRDGEVIIENGARAENGALLIPYIYLEQGNFVLTIPDNELPNYEAFNSTQFLYYLTNDELRALR